MAETREKPRVIPRHSQITQELGREIRSGVWPAGGTLPAEPELARRFEVSRMTMRQALGTLAEQGLLIRQRGRPTQIAYEPFVQPLGRFYSFAYEVERTGRDHGTRVIERGLVRPTALIREAFGLEHGAQVAQLSLLRLLGDEPLLIETISFRAPLLALVERPEVTERPIYDLLDEAGVVVTRASERIWPIALAPAQARLLDAPARSPAFLVRRTSFARETAIEVRESVVRGDRYYFIAELRRDQLALLG